mgnify:CR=1 FL=1
MDKSNKVAALYIATLKAIALIHQHSHWTIKGATFYGNHKMFDEIYESALTNLDKAAEKFISLFGDSVLDYDLQNELLNKVLSKYSKLEGSPLQMSLAIEKDFLKFSREAYNCFEQEGKLEASLGLDDLIMEIASQRENAVYHLQQTLKE